MKGEVLGRAFGADWVLGLLLFFSGANLSAQADTIRSRPFFTWRDVAILEGFAIATVAVAPLDKRWAERLQNQSVQENRTARRTARFVETVTDPGSVIIGVGLYTYGKLRDNERAADLGLHGLESLVIGGQLGMVLKGIVGRARPHKDVSKPHDYKTFRGFREGNDYQSFPSGHSIAAFAAAASVTAETYRWWPKSAWVIAPLTYGGAATVAWSRMFENKHWASDVITGAAIGTFTGLKVVQWHHTNPGNWIDRTFLGPSIGTATDGALLYRLHFVSPF